MATINAQSNKNDYITIKSGSGDDTITLSDGNFKIYAGAGDDTITLSDGNNYVYAQAGNNTITSGTGNDKLYAGKGSDEFVFNSDIGTDVIYNSTINDSITFGHYFDDAILSFYRKGSDLVIMDNSDNSLTLSKYFKSKSKMESYTQNGVENNILDQTFYYAGSGKIKGTNYNDYMLGSVKKDKMYGYAGDDTFLGGASNDKIYSGSGDNTIIINNGDGHDTLYVDKKAESNTVRFDLGDQITYSKNGKDLVITATDTAKSDNVQALTVKNYFAKNGKDAISSDLSIGSVSKTDMTDIKTALSADGVTIRGSLKKSNTLYGAYDYDNTIYAGNKSDKIYAGNKNNIIYDTKGNDKYYVGTEETDVIAKIFDDSGNDLYNVNNLNTSVFIKDSAGKDTLKIADDVKYTMFFDVSIDPAVAQYDSLFLVANSNYQYRPYTEYVAGGVEIANYFSDDEFGAGKIETITVGGKKADTSLQHFDDVRSQVAAWLNLGGNDFSSAMQALQEGTSEQIQELITLYQGGSVNMG
ncbi:MAG: hypothetical protein K6E29_01285 [Cyanobacteria bacterium RUI128]|nr:hypothetical protein [Cyanobacteria bacterium RUI128]